MNCRKIFFAFTLTLFLIACGCNLNSRNGQNGDTKNKTKGFSIFFVRDKKGESEPPMIWQMDSVGKKQRKASFGGESLYSEDNFSIGKDGQKITWSPPAAFSSIEVMNMDGSGRETVLQADPSSNIEYFEPFFSPDGKRVVFTATEWKEPGISMLRTYLGRINLDKTDFTSFLPNPLQANFANQPSYSPDGSEIVLVLKFSNKSSQIAIVASVSGERKKELTTKEWLDTEPVYAPDRKNIVFTSDREGEQNIFVMNLDGSDIKQLTSKKRNRNPSVSPDGKQIAYSSNRDGNWEIYVMGIDGNKEKRLTRNRAGDFYPEWSKTN